MILRRRSLLNINGLPSDLLANFDILSHMGSRNNYSFILTDFKLSSEYTNGGLYWYRTTFYKYSNFFYNELCGHWDPTAVMFNDSGRYCGVYGNPTSYVCPNNTWITNFELGDRLKVDDATIFDFRPSKPGTSDFDYFMLYGTSATYANQPYRWDGYSDLTIHKFVIYSCNGDINNMHNPKKSKILHSFYPCKVKNINGHIGYKGTAQVNCSVGTLGMYDIIDNKFYCNAGSNNFQAGPVDTSRKRRENDNYPN